MCDNELVYIGETKNLKGRTITHKRFFNCDVTVNDKKVDNDLFNSLYYFLVDDKKDKRLELERKFIDLYNPKCNGLNLDGWNRSFIPNGISFADMHLYYENLGISKIQRDMNEKSIEKGNKILYR